MRRRRDAGGGCKAASLTTCCGASPLMPFATGFGAACAASWLSLAGPPSAPASGASLAALSLIGERGRTSWSNPSRLSIFSHSSQRSCLAEHSDVVVEYHYCSSSNKQFIRHEGISGSGEYISFAHGFGPKLRLSPCLANNKVAFLRCSEKSRPPSIAVSSSILERCFFCRIEYCREKAVIIYCSSHRLALRRLYTCSAFVKNLCHFCKYGNNTKVVIAGPAIIRDKKALLEHCGFL